VCEAISVDPADFSAEKSSAVSRFAGAFWQQANEPKIIPESDRIGGGAAAIPATTLMGKHDF
jgi:hypothetical protein